MIKNILIVIGVIVLGVISGYVGSDLNRTGGEQTVGAISSPDFMSDYFKVGGVMTVGKRLSMKTGTTTVCAIQSPSGTSTLKSFVANFIVSSTTASRVVIAKATTAFATTTAIGVAELAANAQGTVRATTTLVTSLDGDTTFAPNTYVVVGMQGGVGSFSPTGACNAEFLVAK